MDTLQLPGDTNQQKTFLVGHVETSHTKSKKQDYFFGFTLAQYCRENHSHPVNSVHLPHLYQLNDTRPQDDHKQYKHGKKKVPLAWR